MVKQKDILDSINQMLVESFPDYTVYINTCPEKFKRPSFLLELVRISRKDANRSTVENTVYYTITCFMDVNNRYQMDTGEMIELQDDVLQIFQQGYISVRDRAIKVSGSTGGMDTDKAYIDLQIEYFDDRTDDENQLPLITSVTTRMEGNNNETA